MATRYALPATSSAGRGRLWSGLTSVPALLFGFFLAVYALTSAGRFDAADGTVVAATARALVEHHTLALPATTPEAVLGAGGFGYSKYGIGQSLVEMPFVVLGLLLRHFTHDEHMVEWTIALSNSVVTALGCAVFYLLVRRLGASARRGAGLTLLYGLCTLAWVYAKTDFTEPLQALSLLFAAYAVVRAGESHSKGWMAACGVALGVTILTKAALAPVVAGFVLYVLALSRELVGVDWRELPRLLTKRSVALSALSYQVTLLTPVAIATGITLWLNAMRFGSMLNFGYNYKVDDVPFANPLYIGIFGLLFSFNSGLIFYATPVVLGLWGLRRFTRRAPREVVLFAVVATWILVVHAGWVHWAGLADYGPRYLVPVIPFLLLPASDAFPGIWTHPSEHKGALALIAVVAALGIVEQALGITVSFGAYSALTCSVSPCPASLNASQSELLYDLWLLPTSVAYNLFGQAPHVVLSAYPFGATPPARPNWQNDLLDSMRYFWFDFLPHPKVALAAGGVLLGAAAVAAFAALNRAVGLLTFGTQAIVSKVQVERPPAMAAAVRRAGTLPEEP
jgi:4-amino-4-deoxy-L-arabinose transferase-like glycosyltransferase